MSSHHQSKPHGRDGGRGGSSSGGGSKRRRQAPPVEEEAWSSSDDDDDAAAAAAAAAGSDDDSDGEQALAAYRRAAASTRRPLPGTASSGDDSSDDDGASDDDSDAPPEQGSSSAAAAAPREPDIRALRRKRKRSHKNAPQELSSSRPVSRHRQSIAGTGRPQEARDPRFEATSGKVDSDQRHDQKWAFLADQHLSEIKALKKSVKKESAKRSGGGAYAKGTRDMQSKLTQMQQSHATHRQRAADRATMTRWRATEREKVAQGKGVYFPGRKETAKMLEKGRPKKWGGHAAKRKKHRAQ